MAAETVVKLRLIADSSQLVAQTRGASTEVKQLGVNMGASGSGARSATVDISKYGVAANTTRQNLKGLNTELAQMPGLLRQVGAGMAALGAAAAAKHLAELADGWTNLTSKLRLVARDEANVVSVRQQLFDLSQRTRSELTSTADLFSRLTRATTDLGLSEQKRLQITESINKAFQISGATTQEAAASITQLAQGLASGALRGEEFNSVAEQAPILLDLLAKHLGKTRGELRAMAGEGQLTARVITDALLRGGQQLDQQFAQVTLTIGGATTQLANAWQRWVGEASDATGAATLVAMAINGVAGNLNALAVTLGLVGVAWGVKLVAGIVAAIVAKQRAIVQSTALAAAQLNEARAAEAAAAAELAHAQALATMGGSAARATAAETALATAKARTAAATNAATAASAAATTVMGRLGSTLLAFVGGPVGAVILGLGAVTYGVYSAIQAERDHQRQLDQSIAKVKEAAASLQTLHTNWTALANVKPVSLAEGMEGFARGADLLIEKSRQLGIERQRLAAIEAQVQYAQTSASDAAAIRLTWLGPQMEAQAKRVAELAKEVENLRTQWVALGGDISSRLTPAVDGAVDALERLRNANDIGDVLMGLAEGFMAVSRGAKIVTADAAAIQFVEDLKKKTKEADEELKKAGKTRKQLAQTFVEEGLAMIQSAGQSEKLRKDVEALGAAYVKKAAAIDTAKKAKKEETSEAEKYLEKLREEVRTYGEKTAATLRLDAARRELNASQREEAVRLAQMLIAWDKIKEKVDEAAKAWTKITEGNVSLDDEIAAMKDQLAGLTPAQIEYNKALREANQLAEDALVLGTPTEEHQRLLTERLAKITQMRQLATEIERRQAISSGESQLRNNLVKTNNEYTKRNALLSGNRDLMAALNAQTDRITARTSEQAAYNEGVREANDLAARAIALGFEEAEVQALLADRLEKLAQLRDGDQIQNAISQFAADNTFDQLTEAIRKTELALDDAIGAGAVEKVERLKQELGNMRHAMLTGIVDSAQAGLRAMQSMTKDGSRAFQAMQIAIEALTVVQAISAVINQAQGDPYTAFARMAAMVAAVASLGVSISNFGSSGFRDTAAERQERQGTGSVLGDAEQKSESIANATEITAKAVTELVGINRGMLDALQALANAIGAASVSLARGAADAEFSALPTPRQFSNASIGARLGVPSLSQRILGGSSRITDQGIVIFGGALNDLIEEIAVGAYQEVQSRSWAFGSLRTRTEIVDASREFETQFQLVIGSIAEAVRQGALALGLLPADVEAALAAFRVEEMRISLKGLTAEEQQAELQAVFSELFDGLAGSVVPFIAQFQQVGEGLGETLVRVATEVQVIEYVFTQMGIAVDKADPEKFAQFADGIVQAAGGLDAAQELFADFFANFYDSAEATQRQVAAMVRARNEQFAQLGFREALSKDEFRAAFEAIMPTLTPEEIVDWLRVSELVASIEDAVSALMDKFRKAFYSPLELMDFEATSARATSASLLQGLGLDADTTMQQFRALFEQRLPTLSEDAVVQWLRAAQALATATTAQDQYTAAVERSQQEYAASIDALRAEIAGSDFTNEIAGIRSWEAQVRASLNAAAVAAGRQAAAESDLALVHQVAEQRVRQAIGRLLAATMDLIEQLRELDNGGASSAIDSWGSSVARNIETVAAANDDLYERQLASIKSIQDYLDAQLLGDLSGLTEQQKIEEARRQLLAAQAAAMGGDAEAAAELPNIAEAYLRLLRGSTVSGVDFRDGAFGSAWVRSLLQQVVTQGPTATPPGLGGATGGSGGGLTSDYLDQRDIRVAAQEAAHRAELAQQLARHLSDLAGALRVPVLDLMASMGYELRDLARNLGVNLSNITGQSVTILADLARTMGLSLNELTQGLGLQLTSLGGGIRELTAQLGIDLTNMTGVQLESLTGLASSLGLSLSEITQSLGVDLTALSNGVLQLTSQLGIDLNALTVESTQSLAQLAQRLGVDLSELSQSVGVDLGQLSSAQSLLNQALANTIDDLPQAQRDQLAPLLRAITEATNAADANAAIALLEAATNALPADIRNRLAPYLVNVVPQTALDQLDYLDGIYQYAQDQVRVMREVRDYIRRLGAGQGLPGFSVGTASVPRDMAAMIHRDEMIIDPGTSRFLRRYGISVNVGRSAANDDAGVVDELRKLRSEMAELKAELRETGRAVATAVRDEGKADRAQRAEVGRRVEDAVSKRARGG